jgi:alpha-ketoglutarate-dependent taurine dioxygenase
MKQPIFGKRTAIPLSSSLVNEELPRSGGRLPLVIRAVAEGIDLCHWAGAHRAFIDDRLLDHGGILFRGFDVLSEREFARFITVACGDPVAYRERSSPRSHVLDNIYTSTEHPADQAIFVHNENSYQRTWPLKICFLCQVPAAEGGETPIADCRKVYTLIAAKIRDRFERKGWMYVRNFGDGFGLPWREVFGTDDRAEVEEYCRQSGITFEWKDGNRLRIRATAPVTARHPKSGERVWFNHCAFFHVSTLPPGLRSMLEAEFADEDLPTQTYYGDGSPIEPEVMAELRAAYVRESVIFPWREGDILLLDNMLTAHGRTPYQGARRVLVGMSEPISREQV